MIYASENAYEVKFIIFSLGYQSKFKLKIFEHFMYTLYNVLITNLTFFYNF